MAANPNFVVRMTLHIQTTRNGAIFIWTYATACDYGIRLIGREWLWTPWDARWVRTADPG